MASPVIQTVPLGFQWPTVDPFLFCVHHLDRYPAANERFGPAADLSGRPIGQDFEGIDGWRMYHGSVVPGFPAHPHRGFETITYVRQGLIDHSDSLGATARFGRGDVQWMTAGSGIVHSEMFPLLDRDEPNTVELFQIWLNLPSSDKLVDPHFSMSWDAEIPRLVVPAGATTAGGSEPVAEITVIAGAIDGLEPPAPPPHSWASRGDADVAIWHVRLEAGSAWSMPAAAGPDTVRTLYVFDGTGLRIDGHEVGSDTGVVVDAHRSVELTASEHVEALVLQGRPIAEPVAQYGPFVMNTRAEIQQAFADYERTRFGGWPWSADDPTHGAGAERFARHADGTVEHAA